MEFKYLVMQEEANGCFPDLAKTLIGEVQFKENGYLTVIARSDASNSLTMYASGYSILAEGLVPMVYRKDENPYAEETKFLLEKLLETATNEQIVLEPQEITFINLLKDEEDKIKPYQLLWIDHSDGNPQSFYQGYQLIGEMQYSEDVLIQVIWSYYEEEEAVEIFMNDQSLLETKPLEIASMEEVDRFSEICEEAFFSYYSDDVVESCYKKDCNELLAIMKKDLTERKMLHPDQFPWSWKVY
jgi:hypothetical protein